MRRLLVCIVVVGACVLAGLAAGASKPPPFAQQGNYRPVARMQLHDAPALPDTLVGPAFGGGSNDPLSLRTDVVYGLGFKWLRLSFANDVLNWQNVERAPGVYTIDPRSDAAISDLARSKTTIVLCLGVGETPGRPTIQTTAEVEAYAGYVRFMVGHFKGRVGYYKILNEPDTMLSAEQYVTLVERVIQVIRTEHPKARIVIGAGAGVCTDDDPGYGGHGRYSMDVAYLKAVFGSRVARLVDVLAWHPFYGSRADDPYYRSYPETVSDFARVARSAGFTGQYMAAEMSWIPKVDVNASDNNNTLRFPEPVAVKYFLRTTVLHRGRDMITIIAPPGVENPNRLITKAIHANNEILAGATPTPIALTVRTQARLVQRATFQYENGDALVALWRDGLPHDSDPGIAATLTLPNQAGHTATALDPLRARQQRLITTSRSGGLVIKGLLVRDYPVFVRLGR